MGDKKKEFEITHVKGSGPGGQNRNKRMSGVRIKHTPTGLVTTATERRSQHQNLEAAKDRIESMIERHYFRPKKRVATKVSRAKKEERISAKKKRSQKLSSRKIDWD